MPEPRQRACSRLLAHQCLKRRLDFDLLAKQHRIAREGEFGWRAAA